MSGIDLNRAGTPLLEIVSEPELRGAQEAVAYARALHALVRWIGICDGNMQEGSFRCDANVSVRPHGRASSARAARSRTSTPSASWSRRSSSRRARQIEILEDGGKIEQETRLYDPDSDETRSMRTQGRRAGLSLLPRPRPAAVAGLRSSCLNEIQRGMPELPDAQPRSLRARVRAERLRCRGADRARAPRRITSRRWSRLRGAEPKTLRELDDRGRLPPR